MNDRHRVSSTPTVSVLLAVYNAEKYLHAAVESLLAQTFRDFELLALDDGSTDSSLSILREFERKDERIRVLSRENRGQVPTLNELIREARGRYIARMDADDICLPDRFEQQASFLDQCSDHVLIAGWIERMNAHGQPIGTYSSPCVHHEIDQAHLRGHVSVCHPAVMLRRDVLIEVGCYRPQFAPAEDLDLWLRLAEIGKLANLPRVVLQYRMHGESLSEATGKSQHDAMRRACESAWRRRDITGQFEVAEHWRPGQDRKSRHKFAVQWGWVAWNHGHRATWWTYVREAISLRPFAVASWRLLVFGLLTSPRR